MGVEYINEIIILVQITFKPDSYHVITVYGSNNNATKEEKSQFYEVLQKQVDATENNNIITIGDFNGKVGNKNERQERCIAQEGKDTLNKDGQTLTDFSEKNDLTIINTMLERKEIDK